MNKEVIIYMRQKVLYKYKILELKKVLKELVLFFVFQIQEIAFAFKLATKVL